MGPERCCWERSRGERTKRRDDKILKWKCFMAHQEMQFRISKLILVTDGKLWKNRLNPSSSNSSNSSNVTNSNVPLT
jgi:hypothetical protein